MSPVIDDRLKEENAERLPIPPKLKMVIICLRISTVLYIVAGIVSVIFMPGLIIGIVMLVVSLACAVGVEIVIYGLKKYKHWGWIAGLVVSLLYIPSLFIVLGALGVWGLFDAETKSRFPGVH